MSSPPTKQTGAGETFRTAQMPDDTGGGGTVHTQAPVTGDGSVGTPVALDFDPPLALDSGALSIPASNPSPGVFIDGYMSAAQAAKLDGLPSGGIHVDAPLSGDGTVGLPLSIPQADSADDGYLSATDWNRFDAAASTVYDPPLTHVGGHVGLQNSGVTAGTYANPGSATVDAKGAVTAIVRGINNARSQARANAIALLNDQNLYEYYNDFDQVNPSTPGVPLGWSLDQNNGTATLTTASATELGGVVTQTTSAVASSRCNLYDTSANLRPGTKDLYVAFRMAVTGGVNALAQNAMGITTTSFSQQLIAGIIGNFSTANFGVSYNGQSLPPTYGGLFLNLGVAVDALYHLFEFWIIGTTLRARIDGGAIQTAGTAVAGYTISSFTSQCQGGTPATARSHEASWFYAASRL